jgi:hypothetical protein
MEPPLPPIPRADWDEETQALLGDRDTINIFGTLAHHPKLMKRWLVFGNHVLAKSTLPARDRELLILRTGWNCRRRTSGASTSQSDAPSALPTTTFSGSPKDRTRRAGPSSKRRSCAPPTNCTPTKVSPTRPTPRCARNYNAQQLLDTVFTVGQYHLVSSVLNTFRIERDDGVTDAPIPPRD